MVEFSQSFSVNSNDSDSQTTKRGPNFEKNRRPASSKRVTFALGAEGQEQADRISRILSSYKKGGVSQSAVVRGLLQLAESIALESGDPAARPVFENFVPNGSATPRKIAKTNAEAARIWERIRAEILGL